MAHIDAVFLIRFDECRETFAEPQKVQLYSRVLSDKFAKSIFYLIHLKLTLTIIEVIAGSARSPKRRSSGLGNNSFGKTSGCLG